MTIYEIYNQSIKTLPAEERIGIVRLILADLVRERADKPTDGARSDGQLEQLLIEGLFTSAMIVADDECWAKKQQPTDEKLGD